MDKNEVLPISHNIGSATATTAVEAGKGTVKGFFKGGLLGAGLTIGGAALASFLVVGGIVGGIAAAFGAAFLPVFLIAGLLAGVTGGVIASPTAVGVAGFGAALGSAVGVVKGTAHGINKVGREQAASNVMQAEVTAYQAQAQLAAAQNKYSSFPAHGSPMNPAGASISNMQADGRVASGQQLQMA